MTGDGINDAPALKKADVGFAMGTGTEVAKEAGDIVILDNNFASIVKAIRYGRTVFKSIRKFVVFQLTMNLCAVGVSLIAPFIGVDTPVTVIQMLWINIIMDTLAGLAFAGEPALKEYMEERPTRRDEPVLSRHMIRQDRLRSATSSGFASFSQGAPVQTDFSIRRKPALLLYRLFALFVFSGVFNAFNARTERINLFSHLKTINLRPLYPVGDGGAAAPDLFRRNSFRCTPLTVKELGVTLALSLTVIPRPDQKGRVKEVAKDRLRRVEKRLTERKRCGMIKTKTRRET
ncbi:MAG: HAD-IC family P-type ATPase [Christensenellaceae bacterium]